jgi:hypothetical protein
MTIPESAINATKAVLAKCAANDPWFPQPAEATILAWAEQFVIAKIPLDDLLAAVTQVYATNGSRYRPLPGDIIKAARAIRADRAERESNEQREQRWRAHDRKAADEIRGITGFTAGRPTKNKTPRLIAAEKALQCAVGQAAREAIHEYLAAGRHRSDLVGDVA